MNTEKLKEAVNTYIPTDSAIDGYLHIGTKKYEIQSFETEFQQEIDHKGQPQHEVKGGLISVTLRQTADEQINRWMFQRDMYCDGFVAFAPISRAANAPLKIVFKRGRCISYQKLMGASLGIYVTLLISAKEVSINGVEHKNQPNYVAENSK